MMIRLQADIDAAAHTMTLSAARMPLMIFSIPVSRRVSSPFLALSYCYYFQLDYALFSLFAALMSY